MEVIYLSPDELIPYEHNAKQHPDSQVKQIAASIKQFGFRQPIVVDGNNVVVIGHGRLLAAKELGLKEVPVVRADDLTEKQIKALRLADNKTNESGWDFTELEAELAELEKDFDMGEFGFTGTTDISGLDGLFVEAPEKEPEEPKQIKCPHCGEWFTP